MVQKSMTPTKQLITQLESYLKPTQPGQYAVVVSRRFLVQVLDELRQHEQRIAAIEMAASQSTNDLVAELMQLRRERTEYIGLAVSVLVEEI